MIELESVRPVSNLRYMKLYIALASTDEHIYIFFFSLEICTRRKALRMHLALQSLYSVCSKI